MFENRTRPHLLRRILAGVVDYILIYIITLFLIFTLGEQNSDGEYALNGILALVPILFWFLMTVGIETSLGYTLGNGVAGIKPIPLTGESRKLTLGESLKRHLLDPIDMSFFGIVGIITINSTEKNQRLGDLWGKTIVVKQDK
ncbi:RDD family protein [Winogradskyella sp.]